MGNEINTNSNPIILKMKGTNKTLDTSKLVGLRQTEQNKAIFDRFDENHNGVLEEDEAQKLTDALYSKDKALKPASKDTTISQREMNRAFGNNTNSFAALNALADQQAAVINGKEYTETNGDKTTRLYQSNINSQNSYRAETQKDGSTIITNSDGSYEIDKGDTRELYTADKKLTELKHKGGSYEKYDPETGNIKEKYEIQDGTKELRTYYNADGQVVQTKEQEIDGMWVIRDFDPTSETPNEPTSIKVQYKDCEFKYDSTENFNNDKKSSSTEYYQYKGTVLEHMVKETKFTYNEDGTITAVKTFTNDKGEIETETTVTDAQGKPIEDKPTAEPINITVKAGASNNAVAKQILTELGAEITPDNIKTVFAELKSEMKYKSHGIACFGAHQKITIPQSLIDKVKPQQQEAEKEAEKQTEAPTFIDTPIQENKAIYQQDTFQA